MASELGERLRRGEQLVGTVLTLADPALAELAAAPFDFVWVDLEHGALTVRDVHGLSVAASAAGCATLVRLPRPDSELLGAVLDIGVDGVVAPRVEHVSEAAALVARTRHPPDGSRGFAHRRWNRWGREAGPAAPVCVVQIESAAAVVAAADIAAVEGVDALVVGPADLALDLGVPASLDGGELRSALASVRRAAHRAGVAAGVAAGGEPRALARTVAGGWSLFVYSADVRLYADAVVAGAATARRALGGLPGQLSSD